MNMEIRELLLGPFLHNTTYLNSFISNFVIFIFKTGTFNLHFYTDKDAECPLKFSDTPPCFIENADKVRLQSFSTGIHDVQTAVHYRQLD